ncbi:hypothetical protein VTO58DRAFT_103328 [Aureobasidium pullulans]
MSCLMGKALSWRKCRVSFRKRLLLAASVDSLTPTFLQSHHTQVRICYIAITQEPLAHPLIDLHLHSI